LRLQHQQSFGDVGRLLLTFLILATHPWVAREVLINQRFPRSLSDLRLSYCAGG